MSDDGDLERGLAVVEALAPHDPSVADIVDMLESVVAGPDAVREVLTEAEARDLIERDQARIRPGPAHAGADRRDGIVTKHGEFTCRRCSRGVSTGYFIRLEAQEIGPYGSTCIRKVTGRE